MSIDKLLDDEIQAELEALKEMELGSETHKVAVEGLTKLTDRAIEMKKLDHEREERGRNREIDDNFKLQQMKEEKTDRLIKNCIAVAGLVLPIGLTIWGANKSWRFEEEGTITTTVGRGFMNRLLPRK